MAATKCPTCGTEGPDSDRLNRADDERSFLTCAYCGYVGAWDQDAQGWRPPTSEEHQVLLGSEEYLELMEYSLALSGWRERDRERLRQLLSAHFSDADPATVDRAAEAILADDFHTHPSDTDLEALNLPDTLEDE